jgi:hypothetical protein
MLIWRRHPNHSFKSGQFAYLHPDDIVLIKLWIQHYRSSVPLAEYIKLVGPSHTEAEVVWGCADIGYEVDLRPYYALLNEEI